MGMGFALNDLADAYSDSGQFNEAVNTYRRAVEVRTGIGHKQRIAVSLRGLGYALHRTDDGQAAREAWRRALNFFEEWDDSEADDIRMRLDIMTE